ncbi:hypothetical protein JEQ12_002647, partial [Ovis aries]
LRSRDGSEYLIQHDSEAIISTWHSAIVQGIQEMSADLPPEEESENSGVNFGSSERLGSWREDEPRPGAAPPTPGPGGLEGDISKVRQKLLKFLLRRPTLQSLREKGYIKDQVFGCPLAELCEREKSSVPRFVQQSIRAVEARGLDIDGLYRISGNLATIQKLRYKVDHDERLDLEDGHWEDVHVITGALKLFFRELPEPLFPFSHFRQFLAAIKLQDPAKRFRCVRDLVRSLPVPNHDTLRVLFQHLCRVIEHGERNRMSVQNVAIVFGPTLLRPETEEASMPMTMVFQNQQKPQVLRQPGVCPDAALETASGACLDAKSGGHAQPSYVQALAQYPGPTPPPRTSRLNSPVCEIRLRATVITSARAFPDIRRDIQIKKVQARVHKAMGKRQQEFGNALWAPGNSSLQLRLENLSPPMAHDLSSISTDSPPPSSIHT